MKNHKVAWLITALLVVVAIAFGQFKAPVQQSDSFYVTDKADLFSKQEEAAILSACQQLLQDGGARMVIVTVNHTGLKSMESYTEKLWDSWKLSSIDMLLVMQDDDYYFLYGSELWETMDYAYRDLLDRGLEPKFAVGDYGDAVLDFIYATETVLTSGGSGYEDWGTEYQSDSRGVPLLGVLIFVMIIAVCVSFSEFRPASKRSYYGGYATPSAGTFVNTMGKAATRSAINTIGSSRPSASRPSVSRPASRPASRPSSFGGGARRSGGSFGGGGGRGGGRRGGGGRR